MKPLEGITVVELSTYIAAPSCGRILATQGARVIKVESPAGDVERKFGPTLFCPANDEENPIYDTLNGGKDHLMLDLKKPEDMERFHKLLAKADVFVTNNRLQALKKMRLDYDSLKERYPKLVYAILLGYGEKGPKVNLPGFDAIAMFATGGLIQDMMVDAPGSYPVYLPMGFGDLVCGTALAGAIGTALYGRTQSGKGDYVSISLYGAAMWMFSVMSTGTQFGYKWPRGRYQGGPMGVPYKTKDGRWILPVVNEYERYWRPFCQAVGAEEIMEQYEGFDDVSDGYWAAEYIKDAAIHGWVEGYGDGTFRADDPIDRAEVVTIVNRLLGREADEDYIADNRRQLVTFPDVSSRHWAYYNVLEAANAHTANLTNPETWDK